MALVGQIVTVSDVLMDGTVNNYIMGADANVFQTNYDNHGNLNIWWIGENTNSCLTGDTHRLKFYDMDEKVCEIAKDIVTFGNSSYPYLYMNNSDVKRIELSFQDTDLIIYKEEFLFNANGTNLIHGKSNSSNTILQLYGSSHKIEFNNNSLYVGHGSSTSYGITFSGDSRPYFGSCSSNYLIGKTDLDSAISTGTSGMANQTWVSQNYQIKGNYQPAGNYALSGHEHSYLGQAGYYYLSYDGTKWTSNIPISCPGLQVDNVAINQNLSVTGQIAASGEGFFNGGTWAVASINSLNGISACSGALWLGKISSGSDAWIVTPKLQITNPSNTTGAHTVTASGSGGSKPGELMWSTGSSKRWKHDIKNVEDNKLNPNLLYNIPVRQFKFNNDYIPSTDQRYNMDVIGFIAEEVYKEYPIAADYYKDSEGNVVCENWNERFILPPMLKLIQDQHQEIETLKTEIAEIKELLKNK